VGSTGNSATRRGWVEKQRYDGGSSPVVSRPKLGERGSEVPGTEETRWLPLECHDCGNEPALPIEDKGQLKVVLVTLTI